MKKEKGGRILAGAMALGILFSGAACGKTYKPEPLSDKTRNLAGTLAADAGNAWGRARILRRQISGFPRNFSSALFRSAAIRWCRLSRRRQSWR